MISERIVSVCIERNIRNTFYNFFLLKRNYALNIGLVIINRPPTL